MGLLHWKGSRFLNARGEEISVRLTRIMKRSFEDVLTTSQREKVDMRTAALMLGIGRVAAATNYLVQVLFLSSFL